VISSCAFLQQHNEDLADGPTYWWALPVSSNPTTTGDARAVQGSAARNTSAQDAEEQWPSKLMFPWNGRVDVFKSCSRLAGTPFPGSYLSAGGTSILAS